MGLRETLEAATPGPWEADMSMPPLSEPTVFANVDGGRATIATVDDWQPQAQDNARLIALAPELADEVLELRERHREAMALALDWGNWTRDFLLGDNIDPGDRADLTALVARLDQIGAADETRLGKEQT